MAPSCNTFHPQWLPHETSTLVASIRNELETRHCTWQVLQVLATDPTVEVLDDCPIGVDDQGSYLLRMENSSS